MFRLKRELAETKAALAALEERLAGAGMTSADLEDVRFLRFKLGPGPPLAS